MQNYTLTIPENSNEAIALLNYLKSINFVKISKTQIDGVLFFCG